MTDIQKTREQIIKALWPYGKPYPIDVVLSRGVGELIFQSSMTLHVTAIEALLEQYQKEALTALLEAMPEKRPDLHKGNIELGRMSGFNEAIDQFTAIIEGQIGGKKL